MPIASVNDIRINYSLAGQEHARERLPVLLVMGFSMPGRAWRFQVPTLSETRAVCSFDNRGSGGSEVTAPPYSKEMLSDDAAGLMDHLGWERAHVVGVSMGGMISQHLALKSPERVASLSLIASHAGGFFARLPTLRGLARFAAVQFGPGAKRMNHTARLLFPSEFRREIGETRLVEILNKDFGGEPPADGRKGQFKAIMGHDTRRRLGGLGVPTLIVKPERDLLIRPTQSERLHALIPQSQILRIADAGHGLIRQSYEQINAALLAHFAAAEGAAVGEPRVPNLADSAA